MSNPGGFQRITLAEADAGCIGVYWGTSFISRLIEWGEGIAKEGYRPPSHAFMIYDKDTILEARWPRVALKPKSEYPEDQVAVYRLPGSALAKRVAINHIAHQYVNRRYGLIAVSAMAFIEPARALGFNPGNYIADKDEDFCSELATVYLDLLAETDHDFTVANLGRPACVDPAGLYGWLQSVEMKAA